jgi:RNA polymerase sigma-B factor
MKPDAANAAEEEAWLVTAFQQYCSTRDQVLRDEIAERTLWIANRSARRFSDAGEPFDDLVQVARLGLLRAIERFDPGHGVPFGAFATLTIMGELRRHFRDHTWRVHVPRRTKDLRSSVNTATTELLQELGRSPLVAEIAERLQLSVDTVIEVMEANQAYRASTLESGGKAAAQTVEADFDAVLDREVVTGLLDQLGPRQRTIIHLRFFEELSQAQIAERIGTSQVHAGRLLASSLAELRRLLQNDPADAPN